MEILFKNLMLQCHFRTTGIYSNIETVPNVSPYSSSKNFSLSLWVTSVYIYIYIYIYIYFAVVGMNLATEGKASQHHTLMQKHASLAIDGNTRSCTKTGLSRNAWWRVHFDNLIKVNALEIKPGKLYILCIQIYI